MVGDQIDELKQNAATAIGAWGTNRSAQEFGEDVAHEQIHKHQNFFQTVESGSNLTVTLAAIIAGGKVAAKGKDGDSSGNIQNSKADGNNSSSGAGSHNSQISDSKMLGENGPTIPSLTLWKGKGKEKGRIDVENPNPGQRAGQVHYQDDKGNKYIYDPKTNSFPDAPKSVNDLLKNRDFKKAIDKGMKYLGD